MTKKILLTVLLVYIVAHAPFRLMGLATETLLVKPGAPKLAQDNDGFWDAINLETRLVGMGWEVGYVRDPHMGPVAVYGVTIPALHVITIDSDLHWSARAAVLAHEAGHTLQPIWMGTVEGDCFAEGVALLMRGDSIREHARYLSANRWTCVGVYITEYRAIYHAAALLTD